MLELLQVLGDRYQLQKLLSKNPLRQTWLAVDKDCQEQVVVKVLAFNAAVDWTNIKLFEREAEVLKQLNYPQIPRYRDYFGIGNAQNQNFVSICDYICGDSLQELLDRGRKFSELEVENIAKDILQILIYLHAQNPPVLHRDIKPSNLILGDDGRIYLIDFGAVQNREATLGSTFTVVGTYGYAPMEQFGDRAIPATDLYGLGATLIHLVTGISPADLPQKELQIQFKNCVNLSPFFTQWLEHLTAPAPERRPSTARQALEMLETKAVSISKFQPQDTRIKLNKSFEQLNIAIPPIDANIGSLPFFLISTVFITPFLSVAAMLSVGFFLKPGITYLIPSVIICSILIPFVFMWFRTLESSCGRVEINLDRENFLVKLKLFGLTYSRKQGFNSEIKNIFSTTLERNIEYSRLGLVIETHSNKYSFSPPLTDGERRWLIQEVKEWLKIS